MLHFVVWSVPARIIMIGAAAAALIAPLSAGTSLATEPRRAEPFEQGTIQRHRIGQQSPLAQGPVFRALLPPPLTAGQRDKLRGFETLRVTPEGTKPWIDQGYEVLLNVEAIFYPGADKIAKYSECGQSGAPSIVNDATYTRFILEKDAVHEIRYRLDVGEEKLNRAINSIQFVAYVIQFRKGNDPQPEPQCGISETPGFNIKLKAPSSPQTPPASHNYVFLEEVDDATRAKCGISRLNRSLSTLADLKSSGSEVEINKHYPMPQGSVYISVSPVRSGCEVQLTSDRKAPQFIFDKNQQALVLMAPWQDTLIVKIVARDTKALDAQKKSSEAPSKNPERHIRLSFVMADYATGEKSIAPNALKGFKLRIDGSELPWKKDPIKIAANRPVPIQTTAPGYVIANVALDDTQLSPSDASTFELPPETPDKAKVTVTLRPADRELVVTLAGRGAEEARGQSSAANPAISYRGTPIIAGTPFTVDPGGEVIIDVDRQKFRIKKASAPGLQDATNSRPAAGQIDINFGKLSYAKPTEIIIELEPTVIKKFRVEVGQAPALGGTLPLVQFGDRSFTADALKTTSLQFNSDASVLELKAPGLRIAAVRTNPEGFARFDKDKGRVILDRARLTDTADGSVILDIDQVLPAGFRIEPVVTIGGKQMPFVECKDFTVSASEPGGASQRPARRQVDGVAGLVLDRELVGRSFELRSGNCQGVSLAPMRIPITYNPAGKNESIRLPLQVEAKRFYVAVAPYIHPALHGQTTIWQQALRNAGQFYDARQRDGAVNTGVLVLEHLKDDPTAVILPTNVLFPRSFPPDEPGIPEAIARRLSGSNTASIEQVVNRLGKDEYKDVTSVYVIAAPAAWSCRDVEDEYKRLKSTRRNVRDATIVIASLSPPLQRGVSDRQLDNPNGNARVYKCGCTDPGLNVFAFDAQIERNDYWKGAFKVIEDSVTGNQVCR